MVTLEKYYKVTAQQEYKKNPKLSAADVQELMEWSNENVEIRGKMVELQIIMFLHACNYDKEYAKNTLRQCFSLRAKKCACYFSGRDPSHLFIQKQLDVVNININSDEDTGYSYTWSQLKIVEPAQYYPTVATKAMFMAMELDQLEQGTKPGYRMVLDSNHFGIGHALRYSLSHARNLMTYVQEGTSFVIDKIYILNVNSGTERLYSTMKPFMSSSLINKIVILKVSKTDDFIKTLPPNVVPRDYGGLAPYMNERNESLKKKLMENRDYFLDEETFRNGFFKIDKGDVAACKGGAEDDDVPTFKNLSID